MKIKKFILNPLEVNCYLIWSEDEAIIIDPGDEAEEILDIVRKLNLKVKMIINTHGHIDHIYGNKFFKEAFKTKIAIHKLDAEFLSSNLYPDFLINLFPNYKKTEADIFLLGGEKIKLGKEKLLIIHTPGHSPGSISIYTKGILFSGDTLFKESVGRVDIPYASFYELEKSIKEKLFSLPDDTIVYPGHGEETSIKYEKEFNIFFGNYGKGV